MNVPLSTSLDEVLIITGPTASGKSSLAYKTIGNSPAVFITIDSKQLYQGLPITSGADVVDLPNITHLGFGHFLPDQTASAVDYAKFVHDQIRKYLGKVQIVLVGGSGFYLKAILTTSSFSTTKADPILRARLADYSLEQLQQELARLSPKTFAALNDSDRANPVRLIRRLELIASPHVPLADYHFKNKTYYLNPPANHEDLIRKRVIARLDQGAIEEVSLLLKNYPNPDLPIKSTIGVSLIIDYQNHHDLDKLINDWTSAEIAYSKRQLTWFKKTPSLIWYDQT